MDNNGNKVDNSRTIIPSLRQVTQSCDIMLDSFFCFVSITIQWTLETSSTYDDKLWIHR